MSRAPITGKTASFCKFEGRRMSFSLLTHDLKSGMIKKAGIIR
jgi:hypothetical protein